MPGTKFIVVDGVLQEAPEDAPAPSEDQKPQQPIAYLSSMDDIKAASQAFKKDDKTLKVSASTTSSVQQMQDKNFLSQFDDKDKGIQLKLNGADLLKDLSKHLKSLEVPIGLMSKLILLTKFNALNFLLDDSWSMTDDSDLHIKDASPMIKERYKDSRVEYVTRWHEQEDRLYRIFEMLSFLPIKKVKINFLNRQTEKENYLTLEHKGQTPAAFKETSFKKIKEIFDKDPTDRDNTPLRRRITQMLDRASDSEPLYVCTDGQPGDGTPEQIADIIRHRKNPKMHPVTFISCTNNPTETEWMQDIDEGAPFVAELDDFDSESTQVAKKQGHGIRYTRGLWLLSHLVAAMSPHELDKLDELTPFSKFSLDNIFGVILTHQEYRYYLEENLVAARKLAKEAYKEKSIEKREEIAREVAKIEKYVSKWDDLERILAPSEQILGLKSEAEVLRDEYSSKDLPNQASATSYSASSSSSASSKFFDQAPAAAPVQAQPQMQDEQPHQSFLQPR